MARVVLDTNVLVSGLLSDSGPPAQLIELWASGELRLAIDSRIELEYREVLARAALGFDRRATDAVLNLLAFADRVVAAPLPFRLPDPSDEPFLEVAVAGAVDALVTGNARHFRAARSRVDIRILTPRDMLEWLRGE